MRRSSHAADAGEDPHAPAPRQRARLPPRGRGPHLPGQLLQGPVPAVRHIAPRCGHLLPPLAVPGAAVLHAGAEPAAVRRPGGAAPRVAPRPPLLDGLVDERDEPLHRSR